MMTHNRFLFVLLAFGLLLVNEGHTFSARSTRAAVADTSRRIRFRIATFAENSGHRNMLSEASVEGAPGTDFAINLQDGQFKMNARFLTDLVNQDALKVRAKIETRRFYGYSEQHLPLYEEDNQSQALQLSFDEGIVLLPFGRNGGNNMLKIEITPSWSDQTVRGPAGKLRPLQIDVGEAPLGGSLNIQASHNPHRFFVEAGLFEDGKEIARGSSNNLLEDAQELLLQPNELASAAFLNNPLAINLSVDNYVSSRPFDEITVGFDVYRIAKQENDKRQPVGLNWAGAGSLGSELKYDLSKYYLSGTGHQYELRFKVRLADGETVD